MKEPNQLGHVILSEAKNPHDFSLKQRQTGTLERLDRLKVAHALTKFRFNQPFWRFFGLRPQNDMRLTLRHETRVEIAKSLSANLHKRA